MTLLVRLYTLYYYISDEVSGSDVRKLTALVFSMNPGEILHDLDEVLDLGVRLHAGAVVDLQAVHHFGHALSVQVQEGLNEIAVDETLKMARNFEKL